MGRVGCSQDLAKFRLCSLVGKRLEVHREDIGIETVGDTFVVDQGLVAVVSKEVGGFVGTETVEAEGRGVLLWREKSWFDFRQIGTFPGYIHLIYRL